MTIDAKLDAIGLVVADMAATCAFYRTLGVAVPDGAESAPHVEAVLPGGLRLMFDTEEVIRSMDPHWTAPTGGGRTSLAFRLPDPAGVDAAYAALTAAGYRGEMEPFDAPWGQRYAVVLDPDGTGADLFAPAAS
ncbi:VOC family protein [Pseudonocardia hydrocarbonoxydans]|uniref:Glyoxalase n=1 Tax=Pseudonocardia hydrocarbonoxydans TaxID=76726 RepID=A0A4Y3WGT0_9PSEU|nr:VOC family protein [Pseudonocardia hydrocarbonoxydans]GEC18054.1 glyoxalase [Pseudonocardia hydrocarbonoxydans]